jgi:hypothetical protein
VSFIVCAVLFERGVPFCVLCLIVVPPPRRKNPFAVQSNINIDTITTTTNNNNNNNNEYSNNKCILKEYAVLWYV